MYNTSFVGVNRNGNLNAEVLCKLIQEYGCAGMAEKPFSPDRGMIRHVIFDFEGTLVDSKEVSILIYNQLAQKYATS